MAACVLHGDCREVLPTLPADSAQVCVTSPPYYGLRDYGVDGQIGLEQTPDEYVAQLVEVFRGVRHVLCADGTAWLNLGDSYASTQTNNGGCSPKSTLTGGGGKYREGSKNAAQYENNVTRRRELPDSIKPKDLLGIPWRVAFALQADGWYLRSAIIWHKPNPMPESVKDRPTSAYEMVFLLAKSVSYFYDADAVREEWADGRKGSSGAKSLPYSDGAEWQDTLAADGKRGIGAAPPTDGRNCRNVWTISPKPYKGAHFATMPIELATRCIKAGSRPGDTVLDPFGGAGTTALAAEQLGRSSVSIELNPEYITLAQARVASGTQQASLLI